jgi:copper(I)-binding protein
MRNNKPGAGIVILLGFGPAFWPLAAMAADAGLTVDHAWARPSAAGQVGVIYLTVKDTGAPDELIGIRTPVSDDAQLHESTMNGSVMQMRPVKAVPVAPGQPLVPPQGGYHITLMNLKQPLKEGDTVPVTLIVRKASAVSASAIVQCEPPPS